MRKWIVQGLTPILCGLVVLLSVILAGRAARASLHDRATYSLRFADIACQPPDGMSRADFLREVRAFTRHPSALYLLDEDLASRLHRVFLAHPCVESVSRVAIDPHGSGSHATNPVRVEMVFRQAVLAVAPSAQNKSGSRIAESGWRVVDRRGVLLPSRDTQRLPVLITEVAAPSGPSGSHWGDARVTAAAQTAAFLQAYWEQLHLADCHIEVVEGEIVFRRPGTRIVWGRAPGQEKEDEAPAIVKLRRLLEYQKQHGGWESLEHDVRFLAYQGHFPLSPDKVQNTVSFYEPRPLSSQANRVTAHGLDSRDPP